VFAEHRVKFEAVSLRDVDRFGREIQPTVKLNANFLPTGFSQNACDFALDFSRDALSFLIGRFFRGGSVLCHTTVLYPHVLNTNG
jgi:hypothetical protein